MYYLYLKTHRITKLKYLGFTSKDPYKYKGSGLHWKRHLRIHGNEVDTEILHTCETISEIEEVGLYYSKLWNVVESEDFANLVAESGKGIDSETSKRIQREKVLNGTCALLNPEIRNKSKRFAGRKHSKETKEKLSIASIRTNKKRIDEGTHNWVGDGTLQRELQRKMTEDGTHNFLGVLVCYDKQGNCVRIPKEVYHSQTGPIEEREYVHSTSKEGKRRKASSRL